MKFFRHDAIKKKVLWVTTIVIILSFGVFGTAYLIAGDQNKTALAGTMYGKKIKLNEFLSQQKYTEIQAIMQYGENYPKVRDYLNFDADTWNRILLLHEANKRKIKISDEQVIQEIQRLPYFQRNNQFDTLTYNDVLRFVFKIKPREFEEGTRQNLKIKKLFAQETDAVDVNDDEIFAEYKKQNEQTKVRYILVEPDAFIDPTQYDEDKARLYWAENKMNFVVPSSVNIEYLSFPFHDEESEIPLEKTQKYFTEEEIDQFVDQIRENPDLQIIADTAKIDLKSSGYFSKEKPNLSLGWSFEMLNTLFQLDTSEIAGPFELKDQIVIARLKDKKEAYVPEYEEVKEEVKTAYLKEQAKEVTQIKTAEYLAQIQKSPDPDFDKSAQALGLNVQETPSFTRGEYLPKIGISQEFENAAFGLSADQRMSDVVELANGFAILFLEKYTGVSQEDFEKNKTAIRQTLLQERQNEVFTEFLTRLRLQAKIDNNISRMRQAARQQTQNQ